MKMDQETVIALFEKSIHSKFHLDRKDRDWKVKEIQRNLSCAFRVPDKHSIGFTLDRPDNKPGAYPYWFFGDNPPEHIAKMCDGIIVFNYKDETYIMLIELKGKNKENAEKQLINGKITCEFLVRLLQEHDHTNVTPKYIALIIHQPRQSPDKPTTSHKNGNYNRRKLKQDCPLFKITNPHAQISLSDYIE